MDFHALPRRDLQALAKRNGIRANMTNGAMADALAALPAVDGIEEYVQQPVAEPVVQATAVEEEEKEAPAPEKQEISLPGGRGAAHAPDEVIVLDDSEEDKDLTPDEDEEKAPARGVGRRRVAWAEPLAATATRKRAAARKADTAEAVAEAVPARATRARSQRTVESVGADEAPKRTVEADADTADAVPEAVPARATRARSQMTVESVAADDAPKTRRTSRGKAGTQQEEEEKATQGDASDVEPAMPAPVSSDEGGDGADEMEAAMDAQNGEQKAPVEEQSQEVEGENEKEDAAAVAVPARATRARSQRKVLSAAEEVGPKTRRASRRTMDAQDVEQHAPVEEQSQEVEGETEKEDTAAAPVPARATRARRQRAVFSVAEEEAPKTRRTSRRAVAKKNSTEQEDEEKATQGDVSDVEASVPAPVSEEMAEAMDAQNAPTEVHSEEDEGEAEKGDAAAEAVPARATRARRQRAVLSVAEEAMPARATRARSQKTVVPAAEEKPTKGRRTSRRAAAKKTNTEQEEEDKRTQDDVSDMEADVPAPVSSDEEKNEPVSSSEEMEVAMDAQNEEQNAAVEKQSEEYSGLVADGTPLVEEEPAAAEDCPVYSSVVEQTDTDTVSSEEIQHSSEDTEMVPVEEVTEEVDLSSDVSEENEDCTAEEEPPVAEDVDSSVQEPLVDVKQWEATEEIHLDCEERCEATVNEVQQATPPSGEATNEVGFASYVEHANEENEECKVEEELQVAEDVQHASEENEDCKVEEALPVAEDAQQCEATEEIQLGSEETEMVPIKEMSQTTEEDDCTSDVDEENEEFEEEPTLAEHVDSSVQEPLVDVQQCEATEKIQLASEDTEMVPVLESGDTEEVDFTSDVVHASEENDVPASEEVLQSAAKVSEKKKNMAAEEVTNNTDMAVEEETLVATDEMPHMLEEVVIDYLSQATVTDDEGAVKESGFSCGLTDVSADVVHASEENDVPASEEVLQSAAKVSEKKKNMAAEEVTNNTDMAVEEETLVATDEMPQMLEEVVIDYLSQATVTDDEGAVKESGFSCGLTDVSADDGVVAADVMLQSSASKGENAEEVVAVDNQSESMVTDDEVHVKESGFTGELLDVFIEEKGVVAEDEMIHSSAKIEENVEEVVTVDNMWQATVTDDEGAAKEDVMEANEMQVSSATIEKSVGLAVTVDQLSQVADDEWAVKESAFTGECTPVVDTARDFSDQIASPWSANVFEDATKSLSMDSITVEPMAKITHSPLTIRKLRRAVAEENEADDVALCIFTSSSGGEENTAEPVLVEEEKEVNQPEAGLAKITHSPLTIRKLRRAVAEENEADDVPQCMKLRRAVAEENEADDVPLCIFTSSSGGEENSAEPVLVEREKEVNDHEALGSLSLRKLRTEFNQIVAVAQENEVKEGEKSSQALDKLSLRKLRTKLKETLNAHKNMEPKRVPLGRLDENAC
ncbi:hypothetical protein ACQ4PT_052166 [Festuca glaucescens]